MEFTDEQRKILLQPIKPHRVSKDGKGFSHVEAYEIKAHLNRLFGFEGWSTQIDSLTCIFETESEKGWTAAYLCTMTLYVNSVHGVMHIKESADASTGDAQNQRSRADAHDLAVKSAVSGALKRCATALGDQFGLSLYNRGSLEPLVGRVIPYEEPQHQQTLGEQGQWNSVSEKA
jgi:recombination DNA repair RAD52 pathway protein